MEKMICKCGGELKHKVALCKQPVSYVNDNMVSVAILSCITGGIYLLYWLFKKYTTRTIDMKKDIYICEWCKKQYMFDYKEKEETRYRDVLEDYDDEDKEEEDE